MRSIKITALPVGVLLCVLNAISLSAQINPQTFENAIGAVVTVAVYETQEFGNRQLGMRGEKPSTAAYQEALNMTGVRSSGSGFVIDYDGVPYVITNSHVIENAAEEEGSLAVYSTNRTKYEVAIVGGDSFYDIAVLRFLTPPGDEFTRLSFREDEINIGSRVFAIGNPLGDYPYTVTDGIVSAKNRVRGGMTGKFGFIQTSATVIWGNSGGPLIDESGEVVGINSQIAFTNAPSGDNIWLSQINFALEGELSQRLISDIIENDGRVDRAYFGFEITDSQQYDQRAQVIVDTELILTGVMDDAPSALQLRRFIGSELTGINGDDIESADEALYVLEMIRSGEKATLNLMTSSGAQNVEISSRALGRDELETTARYLLAQIPEMELIANAPGVQFGLIQEGVQKYDKGKFNEIKPQEKTIQQRYVMLAAGLKSDSFERMWIVDDLFDLGAAMRLTGLSGVLDFYVTRQGDYDGQIDVFRKNFSDQNNIVNKKIWY